MVKYPYFEGDSFFISSNDMLNKVWSLCENTLRVTSLDTTTDSNTRERLPYEADGYITGISRLALQREYTWHIHSWIHNTYNPTWPTEWRQTISLFAEEDYMQTGGLEMLQAFGESMEQQSQLPCVNQATSLVDYNNCSRKTGGLGASSEADLRDIVDWPTGARDGYVLTDVNTVISAYMVGNIRALGKLHAVQGDVAKGSELMARANATAEAVNTLLFNTTTGLYVDGFGVQHSAWHASVFAVAFDLASESRWSGILAFLKEKGMVGSVYAAYWMLKALYKMDSDNGQIALEMMTNCETNSWCHMMQVGATAVMEAWSRAEKSNLSWSHPWASAPASAVVWGFFGLKPVTPGYKSFIFKPQPGNVTEASIRVNPNPNPNPIWIYRGNGSINSSSNPIWIYRGIPLSA